MPTIDESSLADPCPEEIAINAWLEDAGPYMTLPEADSDGWLDRDAD